MFRKVRDVTGLNKFLLPLTLLIPLAIVLELLHANPTLILIASALAIVPLAAVIGEATEVVADRIGPRFGGLLNATLGNAAELIIALVALRAGLIDLVLASITGSILGNLLLVLGLALLMGGIRHGTQKFNRANASIDATMLIVAVIALGIPSMFNLELEPNFTAVEGLSMTTAVAMLIMYGLAILYSFTARPADKDPIGREPAPPEELHWSMRHAVILLVVAVALIALMSEFLVAAVEPVTESLGLSEFFLGIILIPLVGNAAEHMVAVQVAMKDEMDLSLSIAIGSSLQIALFVAPLLVFLSLLVGNPMPLEFSYFELAAITGASFVAALVSLDGESNWLEGAMLLTVYAVLGLGFFFL